MVRLTIPALHSFRDLVLSAVNAAIDAAGGSPSTEVRDQIVSALSEAFNNVVIHAYRGVRGGTVEVNVQAHERGVEIVLLDRGRPFDLLDVPSFVAPQIDEPADLDAMDLDCLPESGMGLFIMRSFMDDVSYQRGGGGKPNMLTLRKSWVPAARTEMGSCEPALALQPLAAEASAGPVSSSKKESSRSGWRMRSVAVPQYHQSTAGSLKRK